MIAPFEFFGRTFSVYQIMCLIGVFLSGFFACRLAKMKNIPDIDMTVFLLITGIGVVIGGSLLYGITNLQYIVILLSAPNAFKLPFELIKNIILLFTGSVFYGGLIGGIFASYIYAKRKKFDLCKYSDIMAATVPLFHIFGRIGCFLGGCCYGIECSFGFIYENSPIQSANHVIRFPVQLFEALGNLLIFLLILYLIKKQKFQGYLFVIYLLLYSIMRFVLEFFRGDEYRGILFGFSTSQIISVIILLIGLIFILIKKQKSFQKEQNIRS